MAPNMLIVLLAALVPMVVGFIWYNPKTFGNAWMRETGMTPEKAQNSNMAKVFGLTFLMSFMVAMIMSSIVIHQAHIYSTLMNEPGLKDPNSEIGKYVADFMAKYGHNFRTFKHGMLHGTIAGVFLALPVIGVNSLFEQKSAKYIWINAGFWIVCFMLMGGIICQWA